MNTTTKNRNKCCKKFGNKYSKNLMDTAKKKRELILLKQLVKI